MRNRHSGIHCHEKRESTRKAKADHTHPSPSALPMRLTCSKEGANKPGYQLIVEETRIGNSEYRSIPATEYFSFFKVRLY